MHTLTIPAAISKRKQACQSCRQRKKKCDAERPVCALCRKWGTRCVYDSGSQIPRNEQYTIDEASVPPSMQLYDDPAFANRPNLNFFGPPQPANLDAELAMKTAPESYPTPESNVNFQETSGHQKILADLQLPAYELLVELVDLFFDNVGHLFPCFHRKHLEQQIREGALQEASPMLLFAMCSMAARFHPGQSVKARQQDWYDQAKLLYELTQRNPYIPMRTIQAVLVLVFHGHTTGDFSAGSLYVGKVWKQAVTLGLNRMDVESDVAGPVLFQKARDYCAGTDSQEKTSAVEQEELRRTLWMLFITDRGYAWPTGSPTAIPELHFKVDLPVPDHLFQAMDLAAESGPVENTPFTRNFDRLIGSITLFDQPLNIYAYLCVAHILLGRVADLVHSLHASPTSAEYAEECEELDKYLVKFRLSLPRQATSIIEARSADREHVVWLQIILNTSTMLLHYRGTSAASAGNALSPTMLAITAARNTVQVVRDASRISTNLLMSAHIAPSLYVAACILVIEWRSSGDQSYKYDIDLLALVFDRMNEIFVFLGLKFKLALEHDLNRSQEGVTDLRAHGLRGLLADCSKWRHVKEEVERRGIPINIT